MQSLDKIAKDYFRQRRKNRLKTSKMSAEELGAELLHITKAKIAVHEEYKEDIEVADMEQFMLEWSRVAKRPCHWLLHCLKLRDEILHEAELMKAFANMASDPTAEAAE